MGFLVYLYRSFRGLAGIRCADADPFFKIGDLFVAELLLGRHLQIVLPSHSLDHQTAFHIPGLESRTGVAAFEDVLFGVHVETAFDFSFLTGVALQAVVGKDGADLVFKKFKLLRSNLHRNGST